MLLDIWAGTWAAPDGKKPPQRVAAWTKEKLPVSVTWTWWSSRSSAPFFWSSPLLSPFYYCVIDIGLAHHKIHPLEVYEIQKYAQLFSHGRKFSALSKLALDLLVTPLPFSSKQSLLYIPHVCLSMMRFTEMGLRIALPLFGFFSVAYGFLCYMHYSVNRCSITFYDRITKPSIVITIVPSGHSPFELLLKHVLWVCFEHLFSVLFGVYLRGELPQTHTSVFSFSGDCRLLAKLSSCYYTCLPVLQMLPLRPQLLCVFVNTCLPFLYLS